MKKIKTHASKSREGMEHVTGTATKVKSPPGPQTPMQMSEEIKQETKKGQAEIRKNLSDKHGKSASWRDPKKDGNTFLVGTDSGVLSWLTPVFEYFFEIEAVGYKDGLRIWNFPPDVDDPKKKHAVTRQYYYKIDGKFVLVDVFDAGSDPKKITLIKAWLEALGYRYTYITGEDFKLGQDSPEFLELIFKERLKPLGPKDKDYPKFKIPKDYTEAKLGVGGVTYGVPV